jgi:hypothetical protein
MAALTQLPALVSLPDEIGYGVENLVGSIVGGIDWRGVWGAADIHEQVACE